MVVALGPGKFYGRSLPRPRIYTDVKLNEERVDPPVPVFDALMSWAKEAHWSMGGFSHRRLRLQGRIEGSIKKLRAEREKLLKKRALAHEDSDGDDLHLKSSKHSAPLVPEKRRSPSPPRAPMADKRRRVLVFANESDDEMEMSGREESGLRVKSRGTVRKLVDEFDRVASESGLGEKRASPVNSPEGISTRTRSRKTKNEIVEDLRKALNKPKSKGKLLKQKEMGQVKDRRISGSASPTGVRTSPRLAKSGSK